MEQDYFETSLNLLSTLEADGFPNEGSPNRHSTRKAAAFRHFDPKYTFPFSLVDLIIEVHA